MNTPELIKIHEELRNRQPSPVAPAWAHNLAKEAKRIKWGCVLTVASGVVVDLAALWRVGSISGVVFAWIGTALIFLGLNAANRSN